LNGSEQRPLGQIGPVDQFELRTPEASAELVLLTDQTERLTPEKWPKNHKRRIIDAPSFLLVDY
jgi:hypothetical protein